MEDKRGKVLRRGKKRNGVCRLLGRGMERPNRHGVFLVEGARLNKTAETEGRSYRRGGWGRSQKGMDENREIGKKKTILQE